MSRVYLPSRNPIWLTSIAFPIGLRFEWWHGTKMVAKPSNSRLLETWASCDTDEQTPWLWQEIQAAGSSSLKEQKKLHVRLRYLEGPRVRDAEKISFENFLQFDLQNLNARIEQPSSKWLSWLACVRRNSIYSCWLRVVVRLRYCSSR